METAEAVQKNNTVFYLCQSKRVGDSGQALTAAAVPVNPAGY